MVRTVAMNVGEQFAAVCFARYGLHVERFAKTELRSGKTPDFPIFKADQFVLYCEAKHVQYDEWLDKRLEQAQPVEIVGGAATKVCPKVASGKRNSQLICTSGSTSGRVRRRKGPASSITAPSIMQRCALY